MVATATPRLCAATTTSQPLTITVTGGYSATDGPTVGFYTAFSPEHSVSRLCGKQTSRLAALTTRSACHPVKTSYAELFCRSNFSFQYGASHPEELLRTAWTHGYSAIAITDECSLAGGARAHLAWCDLCAEHGVAIDDAPLRLILGASFRLDDCTLILLVETKRGYEHLCQLITRCRLSAEKGSYHFDVQSLANLRDCFALIVPGSQIEPVIAHTQALNRAIGYTRLLTASDARRFEHAMKLAQENELALIACGDVLIHEPSRQPLQDILAATRLHCTIDRLGELAQQNAERYLRPLAALTHLYPAELLLNSVTVARQCRFTLRELRYQYPEEFIPSGHTAASYLREQTLLGAQQRYPSGIPEHVQALLEKEFALVADKRYEPYFLTVYDIVREARRRGILCQGRGSAANSAICYCLHITELDPQRSHLLFERFISNERDEPPDIDVDFEHERREEIIQHIYQTYGRHRAALCAVVICYRTKGAIRDVGRALGFSQDQLDRISSNLSWWDNKTELDDRLHEMGFDPALPRVRQLIHYTGQLRGFPRHLSQHPGGFVLADHRLDQQVPIENATMADRSVIQWDKDDIEALGMMKVDVLGLGMLTCIRRALALIGQQLGQTFGMHDIPAEDPQVYDMLCRGESTGVFQVESRAQMSMLPRLKPRNFFDLVVQIAIVRPGPIQGGMVHPYLKRRQKTEAVRYPSPAVESVLKRTLGIPIFQEQVMELSMKAAGFTAGEADNLRRSMAAWKRKGGLGHLREKLINGMLERGYSAAFAESVYKQVEGFGSYGFPESHAASFAILAYSSAWMKCHFPAAFCCALLNSQPMGFYSPSQLVQDARQNGVHVLPIDINHSDSECSLILPTDPMLARSAPCLRLGFNLVKGLGQAVAERIIRQRGAQPYADVRDLVQRAGLDSRAVKALADADAFNALAGDRIQAKWMAAAVQHHDLPLAPSVRTPVSLDALHAPLKPLTLGQEVIADYRSTGLTLRAHPLHLLRGLLKGTETAERLKHLPSGRNLRVAGLVTCRQRPGTASGVTFVTLEDETGNTNVVVWRDLAEKERRALIASRLMIVHGKLERQGPVIHLMASHMEDASHLLADLQVSSHDFH
ncbi:MAG: error-prone DNA polymerase [Burkholderiales bacterium]|nr:error-prone DNA polymerase [Burkholderiales bacterium]